jgi:CRP/FNR family transcriptional regulator, cyclic AMP receptor protein
MLAAMNPAELFAHETDPVLLAAGQTLFHAGDAADGMFVVLEGALEIVVGGKVVETSERGAIIGEMALIDRTPRGATVRAKDAAKLVKIDERRFQRVIQQNPFFATHVMKVLVERIKHMNVLLAQR